VAQGVSLELKNIALQRGDRLLIKGLSLRLNAGEAIELRGANGMGKTTLLRAIAGLHRPQFGEIIFSGKEDCENHEYLMFLGHNDAIKPNESVYNQLVFWAQFFDAPLSRIDDAVTRLGISRLLPLMGGGLSAGQKRRVAIIRLMIAARPLWLLDEPFAPLDEKGRTILGEILNEHRQNNGIIIAAVHDKPKGNEMQLLDLAKFSPRESDGINV
jgi:heme exporter protein A